MNYVVLCPSFQPVKSFYIILEHIEYTELATEGLKGTFSVWCHTICFSLGMCVFAVFVDNSRFFEIVYYLIDRTQS